MMSEIIVSPEVLVGEGVACALVPQPVVHLGPRAIKEFYNFFAADIPNPHTRDAYLRAVTFFCAWCSDWSLSLDRIEPIHVAAYLKHLEANKSKATVKQALSALNRFFDWYVVRQIIPHNPAASCRGPAHVVKEGLTPIPTLEEVKRLFAHIETDTLIGLRDRALLGTLFYAFARVGAAVGMRVGDFYPVGDRMKLRLNEKGGKVHTVFANHLLEEYVSTYLEASKLTRKKRFPLFQSFRYDRWNKTYTLTGRALDPRATNKMLQRRVEQTPGFTTKISCHSLRALGITTYVKNGGSVENARVMANHANTKTTNLYVRTDCSVGVQEWERVIF